MFCARRDKAWRGIFGRHRTSMGVTEHRFLFASILLLVRRVKTVQHTCSSVGGQCAAHDAPRGQRKGVAATFLLIRVFIYVLLSLASKLSDRWAFNGSFYCGFSSDAGFSKWCFAACCPLGRSQTFQLDDSSNSGWSGAPMSAPSLAWLGGLASSKGNIHHKHSPHWYASIHEYM